MAVTSFTFLIFCFIVFALYYWLARRAQNALLLAASAIFLGWWSFEFVVIFGGLVVLNYVIAQRIVTSENRNWLRGGITLNVAALAYFKYADFFVPDLLAKFGDLPLNLDNLKIILPVGLSFLTVQMISYLLDVNRKLIPPADNIFDFSLYAFYFPKLTSGPLERYREFLPKIAEKRRPEQRLISDSFALVLQGLFRKIVLADVLLTLLPTDIFTKPQNYSSPELTMWLLAYAFALYNDFAGYTKLIRGVSGFFGIQLVSNFNVPYFARNFTEFWQRWHISLSNWLRDYIFMPLTRSLLRKGYKGRHPLSIILPPMVTMLVSALWHEVSLNMLLWGGLHGLYQVLDRVRSFYMPGPPAQRLAFWRQGISMIFVLGLAILAWIPFRMELSVAWEYFIGLVQLQEWNNSGAIDWHFHFYWLIGAALIINFIMDFIEYKWGETSYTRWHPLPQAILINIVFFMLFIVLTAQSDTPPPFIYQGF